MVWVSFVVRSHTYIKNCESVMYPFCLSVIDKNIVSSSFQEVCIVTGQRPSARVSRSSASCSLQNQQSRSLMVHMYRWSWGVGLVDLWRSLPVPNILWFYCYHQQNQISIIMLTKQLTPIYASVGLCFPLNKEVDGFRFLKWVGLKKTQPTMYCKFLGHSI